MKRKLCSLPTLPLFPPSHPLLVAVCSTQDQKSSCSKSKRCSGHRATNTKISSSKHYEPYASLVFTEAVSQALLYCATIQEQSFHKEISGLESTESNKTTQNNQRAYCRLKNTMRLSLVSSISSTDLKEKLSLETCIAQSMSDTTISHTVFFPKCLTLV